MADIPKDYPVNRIKRWLLGWVRSWTANAATIITVLGVLQTNIETFNLSPKAQGLVLTGIGVLMAILRAKTSTPVAQR